MLGAAQSKEEAAFKGFTALKRGLWYINSPFQVQKIFSSHSASPLSLLVSSACSCSPAGRHKTRLRGRWLCWALTPVSPQWSCSNAGEKQPWATKNSHRGPQLGPSPRRGQRCLCGANGAGLLATLVPTTQSRLLFYSHEKLIRTVKVSHFKCWYEAL